jgi:putative protease
MLIPELLAPVGSPQALDAALAEGADAVYLGLKTFNARLRSANFTYAQCEAALKILHRRGRKIYLTLNTVFEQREADQVYQLLKYLSSIGPDALIVQDLGILAMVRDYFPQLKIHASTQMNIASARGANILSKYGVSRVVLARELSLTAIQSIRSSVTVELECFVHGALCMSVSGLCLFSSYLGGKSANRGLCTQACRRRYQQGNRAGYYFSPFDLQLLAHIPALAESGINAVKIEGRMKSADYVGAVVRAYRLVLDSLDRGVEAVSAALQKAQGILHYDFARHKTTHFFESKPAALLEPAQSGATGIPLGTLSAVREGQNGRQGLLSAAVCALNKGDSIRLHRANDSERQSHKIRFAVMDKGKWWVSIPEGFGVGDYVYLIQTKATGTRYEPVLPKNLRAYRKVPGIDKAPVISLAKQAKKHSLPHGLYAAVSHISDLYVLQSIRPVKVMLSLTENTVRLLCAESAKTLPFKPAELILVLDPYFSQEQEPLLASSIQALLEKGYTCFVLNNLGQFSYFRGSSALLIGGPYLYTFNRFALSFVQRLGLSYTITPFENNRQNVERTVEQAGRSSVFITVFAYPALFRMGHRLDYDFTDFADSRGQTFKLVSSESSLVLPQQPFSLVDKIPFLKEAGFTRFIIDLTGEPIKKLTYKTIMHAALNAVPLPGISRFNWKDGFYRQTCEDHVEVHVEV